MTRFGLVVLCILKMCQGMAGELPAETIVFRLGEGKYSDWKEITRVVDAGEGVIELIPCSQTVENWTDLLAIQYDCLRGQSLEAFVEVLKRRPFVDYPGKRVSWNCIAKKEKDILYEWILHEPYHDVPAQHEVARIFFTAEGMHKIGFTKKTGEMASGEREKWIGFLSQGVRVVKIDEVVGEDGSLSLIDRSRDRLDMGFFKEWKLDVVYPCENGFVCDCRLPPSQDGDNECLEVKTRSSSHDAADFEMFFSIEKKAIKEVDKKYKIKVLKRSPREVVFYFSHKSEEDKLIVGMTRMFFGDYGYYAITHKRHQVHEPEAEEISLWQGRLATIKIDQ